MSIKSPARKKATDDNRTDSQNDIALIDADTIRRLEDEDYDGDEPTCRFAAVARKFETVSVPNTTFELPCTRVAYVDESGEYGVEREFFGHRENWSEIPRTIAVTEDDPVREIPARHTARYESILATYQRVLSED